MLRLCGERGGGALDAAFTACCQRYNPTLQLLYLSLLATGYYLYCLEIFARLPQPYAPLWHQCATPPGQSACYCPCCKNISLSSLGLWIGSHYPVLPRVAQAYLPSARPAHRWCFWLLKCTDTIYRKCHTLHWQVHGRSHARRMPAAVWRGLRERPRLHHCRQLARSHRAIPATARHAGAHTLCEAQGGALISTLGVS